MIRFAYNHCCGLYELSSEGIDLYNSKYLKQYVPIETNGTQDPIYISVIEELGNKAVIYDCPPDIIDTTMEELITAGLDTNSIDFNNIQDYYMLHGLLYNLWNKHTFDYSSDELSEDIIENYELPGGNPIIIQPGETFTRIKR